MAYFFLFISLFFWGCYEECSVAGPQCSGDVIGYCIDDKLVPLLDCGEFEAGSFDAVHTCLEAKCVPDQEYTDLGEPKKARNITDGDVEVVYATLGLEGINIHESTRFDKSFNTANIAVLDVDSDTPKYIKISKATHEAVHYRQQKKEKAHGVKYLTGKRYRLTAEIEANIAEISTISAIRGKFTQPMVDRRIRSMSMDMYRFDSVHIRAAKYALGEAMRLSNTGGRGSTFGPIDESVIDALFVSGFLEY